MSTEPMPATIRAIPMPFAEDERADRSNRFGEYATTEDPCAFAEGFGDGFDTPLQNGGPPVMRWHINELGYLATYMQFYLQCGGLFQFNADFAGSEAAGNNMQGYAKGAALDFAEGDLNDPEGENTGIPLRVMRIVSTKDDNYDAPSAANIGYDPDNPGAYAWACVTPPTDSDVEDALNEHIESKAAALDKSASLSLDEGVVKICVSQFTVGADSWMFFSTREDGTAIAVDGDTIGTAEKTTNGCIPVMKGAVVTATKPIDAYLFPVK